MRLIAHYDADGTIHALLRVDAPKGISIMVAPEPGLFAGEVDEAELEADDGSAEALELMLTRYRVATVPRLKLTHRED
ncbi:MAG TPA: hypothetical protein VFP66_08615 [Candidatus Limnocylindrales bacterium]|nr:hypothetical protein [Candidatus Limnocylindrales bacterium]